MMRSRSLSPDSEGSATSRAAWAPLRVAITGQPMPGEPSMTAKPVYSPAACSRRFFTWLTSSPEVPLPILSLAVEKTAPSP